MGFDAKHHLQILSRKIGSRSVGSPGWRRARWYIKSMLSRLGLDFNSLRFRLAPRIPYHTEVEVYEDCWQRISSVGVIGSPPCEPIERAITFVQYGREQEYTKGKDYTGTVVLSCLGKISELEKAQIAAEKGAAALLLFDSESTALPTVVIAQGVSPIPTLVIRRGDALQLAKNGGKARIAVSSRKKEIVCEDIIVEVGKSEPILLLTSHYDTMPPWLGPMGSAMGTAVMLALLKRLKDKAHRRVHFAFFDAEEVASAGSKTYFEFLEANGMVEKVEAVIDLSEIGTRRGLDIVMTKEKGEPASSQVLLVQEAFEKVGMKVLVRTLKRGQTRWIASYPRYLPVFCLRGRPSFPTQGDASSANPFLLSRVVTALETVVTTPNAR